jgi:hypothetical protein
MAFKRSGVQFPSPPDFFRAIKNMSQDLFKGDIDPEIAALLGDDLNQLPSSPAKLPEFRDLFDGETISKEDVPEVDLSADTFPDVPNLLNDTCNDIVYDPEHYKKCLSGEGEPAQRLHGILQKYISCKDAKDRGVFRQQLVPAYWELLASVARKAPGKLPEAKALLLRFGILHPGMLSHDDLEFFGKIICENTLNQPIYYFDEWFKAVGTGAVKNSVTDEVRVAKSNEQNRLQSLLDKAVGKRDAARNLLRAKNDERRMLEKGLLDKVQYLSEHVPLAGFPDVSSVYTEGQKRAFSEIQEFLKSLAKADKELSQYIAEFGEADADVETLEGKIDEAGVEVRVDLKAVATEFETVRQMNKLSIGKQGNHFPILTREYFRCGPSDVATRENVIRQLAWVESIDSQAFCRSYKNKLNRIIPFVILLPNYGDTGVCWEPFDRYNRATSRGRIAIPMYSKNLGLAVLSAVADLRWQVAKEKASYYWMEEGLTGHYYQHFQSRKLKGDVKEFFIADYIIWMTKESDAMQKLDKETRAIFWRHIPFAQDIKEKLKNRSYIYQELYQRDINRSMSDGY